MLSVDAASSLFWEWPEVQVREPWASLSCLQMQPAHWRHHPGRQCCSGRIGTEHRKCTALPKADPLQEGTCCPSHWDWGQETQQVQGAASYKATHSGGTLYQVIGQAWGAWSSSCVPSKVGPLRDILSPEIPYQMVEALPSFHHNFNFSPSIQSCSLFPFMGTHPYRHFAKLPFSICFRGTQPGTLYFLMFLLYLFSVEISNS